MPQGATAVSATITAAKSVMNISTAGSTLLKTGKGVLNGVTINTGGATGATVTLYDGTTNAGGKLGTWSATAQFGATSLGIPFNTGLFVVVVGTPDVTISYS